ncbi:hypothetical protein PT285_07045 [Lactobacillus sp. ESL0791]|uniref:hypothetical protein n=1 Tax=Lactobacillus sp. ESL0791 TaxID=2983234 RepID=UPI0023F86C09|nr:hypothetical protein [Lactobacillus sp. ESL0791]MDF7639155.1 hypothetical protein [Lactobacillus sp. ESL0791]
MCVSDVLPDSDLLVDVLSISDLLVDVLPDSRFCLLVMCCRSPTYYQILMYCQILLCRCVFCHLSMYCQMLPDSDLIV